jgi:hypothetical protein
MNRLELKRWISYQYKLNIKNYTQYLAEIEIIPINGNLDIGYIGGSRFNKKLIDNYNDNQIQLQPFHLRKTTLYKDQNQVDIYLNEKNFMMKVYLYKEYDLGKNEWKNKTLVMNRKCNIFNYINIITYYESTSISEPNVKPIKKEPNLDVIKEDRQSNDSLVTLADVHTDTY